MTVRDGEPRMATSTFTRLLSSALFIQAHCCFTSTETIRTIRDREPRTATSTFTQLLSSVCCPLSLALSLRQDLKQNEVRSGSTESTNKGTNQRSKDNVYKHCCKDQSRLR